MSKATIHRSVVGSEIVALAVTAWSDVAQAGPVGTPTATPTATATVTPGGTPTPTPPAQKTICDPLVDATPGLYGLCVAYCEAQDCDEESFVSGQCKPPSPVILKNYDKKKEPEDPEMPCLPMAAPCPCFTDDDLRALTVTWCFDSVFTTHRVTGLGQLGSACSIGSLRGDHALLSAGEFEGERFGTCRLLDFSDSCDVTDFIQTMDLFEDEANACPDLILDEVAALGLICN